MKKRKITTLLSKCLFEPTIFVQYHVDVIIYHAAISYDTIQFIFILLSSSTFISLVRISNRIISKTVNNLVDVRGADSRRGYEPRPPTGR